jgi:hypothetical protein
VVPKSNERFRRPLLRVLFVCGAALTVPSTIDINEKHERKIATTAITEIIYLHGSGHLKSHSNKNIETAIAILNTFNSSTKRERAGIAQSV